MGELLIRPSPPDAQGRVLRVTPESADWTYVWFDLHRLAPGQSVDGHHAGREVCLVLVAGRASITAGEATYGDVGGRASPFEGKPASVFVPADLPFRVVEQTPVELAICSAPGKPGKQPRLISPDTITPELRGQGSNRRLGGRAGRDDGQHRLPARPRGRGQALQAGARGVAVRGDRLRDRLHEPDQGQSASRHGETVLRVGTDPAAQALAGRNGSYQIPSNVATPVPPEAPDVSKIKLIDYDFAKFGSAEVRKRLLTRWMPTAVAS